MDIFVFISTVFIWASGVSGLICHCDEHCPDDHKNYTCVTKYKCFKVKQYIEGTNRETKETHGCSLDESSGGHFQCRSQKTPFYVPTHVECCDDGDLCNTKLKPILSEQQFKAYEAKEYKKVMYGTTKKHSSQLQHLALAISITVCAMLLIIIVVYLALRYVQIKAKQKNHERRRVRIPNGTAPVGSIGELLLGDSSSGTGSGVPILTQRTIAREVSLFEEIGRGRFGIVYKGRWREQVIAAKIVHMFDEISWRRELDFYETCNLIHENILGFIAGDIWEPIPGQGMQRLLITVFHEFGSLHDFLKSHSYDSSVLYRLAYTAVSGLVHIHRKVDGHKGKPALAHRDIKSKNILVKNNLQCCLGDFGLSIKCVDTHEKKKIDFGNNHRLPTYRYMAPEMLNDVNTMESFSFETYQKTDIYAFGLVLWEMTLRYEVSGAAEEYQLPFTDYLETNEEPTFNEMREIIVEEHKQLQLPEKYDKDEHAKIMTKLMSECYSYSSSARLTALRIRKTLERHLQDNDKEEEESNTSSIETASTGMS